MAPVHGLHSRTSTPSLGVLFIAAAAHRLEAWLRWLTGPFALASRRVDSKTARLVEGPLAGVRYGLLATRAGLLRRTATFRRVAVGLAAFCLLRLVRAVMMAVRHPRTVSVTTIAVLTIGALGVLVPSVGSPVLPAAAAGEGAGGVSGMSRVANVYGAHKTFHFKTATAVPNPAIPSVATSTPLQSHEVFGFAPYWTLSQSSSYDVADLTTVAYFSIGVNPDGSFAQSGPGWSGFESQDFTNLVNRAHAAGDRVVLTVSDFDQSSLDQLTSSPPAAARLAAAVLSAVESKNLDGVNLDLEGEGSGDQVGLTSLVQEVSTTLHAANSHYQVTMDTYPSSAGDPGGFYNVSALAPWVDGFFVMEYQYNLQSGVSAQSPITSSEFSNEETLQQYTSAAPASKVILGVPYYGLDWNTTNGTQQATSTGGEPSALTVAYIASQGHSVYWDPVTDTPWTSYQVGDQWHETYFEDPTSVYMETQLAERFGIAGMGIWALGMDNNDPAMMAAILGNAPAKKDTLAGPTSTSASPGERGASPLSPSTNQGLGAGSDSTNPSTNASTNPSTKPSTTPSTTGSTSTTTSTTAPPATACASKAPATWTAALVAIGCWQDAAGDAPTKPLKLYAPDAGQSATPPATTSSSSLIGLLVSPNATDPVLACLAQFAEGSGTSNLTIPVSVDATVSGTPKVFYVSVAALFGQYPSLTTYSSCASLQGGTEQWLELTSQKPTTGSTTTTTTAPPTTTVPDTSTNDPDAGTTTQPTDSTTTSG